MAYEKQTWEDYPSTNTPITSDKLNHIEQGIYDNSTTLQTITTTVQNIIASGSNANGNYVKYSDGTMICYNKVQLNTTTSNEMGSGYTTDLLNFPDFPVAFVGELPTVTFGYQYTESGSYYGWIGNGGSGANSLTLQHPGSVQIFRFTSGKVNGVMSYIAIGKWK